MLVVCGKSHGRAKENRGTALESLESPGWKGGIQNRACLLGAAREGPREHV